ncbi:hypothetical protein FPV67DRAFT_1495235 [Lyophyllum atratum]|nr:hypothetical protein FPV67DRAFT_1495235 [Lyophyllum atratum]
MSKSKRKKVEEDSREVVVITSRGVFTELAFGCLWLVVTDGVRSLGVYLLLLGTGVATSKEVVVVEEVTLLLLALSRSWVVDARLSLAAGHGLPGRVEDDEDSREIVVITSRGVFTELAFGCLRLVVTDGVRGLGVLLLLLGTGVAASKEVIVIEIITLLLLALSSGWVVDARLAFAAGHGLPVTARVS